MKTKTMLSIGLAIAGGMSFIKAQEAPEEPPGKSVEKPASKSGQGIQEVTLYQGTALVTRRITIPEERGGSFEMVVKGLPTTTDPESVFVDGSSGLEIRSVTCRMRSSEETLRVETEVKKLDDRIDELERKISNARNEIALRRIRQEFLRNLGNFVAPAARQEMEHGVLQAEELSKVTQMHFEEYETASQEIMKLDFEIDDDSEELSRLRSERGKLVAGPTQIYDAVVFVEKEAGTKGEFSLNYLVKDCGWSPVYNVRGQSGGDEVKVELNALIHQVSGESWEKARLILSTASPTVSAQNPELTPLHVQVRQGGVLPQREDVAQVAEQVDRYNRALQAKKKANKMVHSGRSVEEVAKANYEANEFAASAQLIELSEQLNQFQRLGGGKEEEELAIQYELQRPVSLVSRREAQMVPVLEADCPASFYHIATPVLTSAVFREADLVNTSGEDLLGGKVNVYLDDEFIGRTEMPTIARGRNYTLGFGVDGQLRARRNLVERTETVQGGNRQVAIGVEVVLDNYKEQPINLRLRERTPFMEDTASLRVSLSETSLPLSRDRDYTRFERPKGILRWDLLVEPGTGEKSTTLNYAYRLEFDKSLTLEEISGEKASILRSEFMERARRR
ncbi:MAG: mucoidy inhibitor MuiA family protein [Verrucomicrobiota bacterium JB023]|nr:mucoidy inhibitor MuiA family protein [Verrucomicrobiota bacterium JB023]